VQRREGSEGEGADKRFFVEKGMSDGQRIILAGAGDQEVHLNIIGHS